MSEARGTYGRIADLEIQCAGLIDERNILTADLAAARKTIDGMREALEPFGAGASLMEADSDDRVVSIGRWHDTDYPRFIADIRVSVADIRRARAALAQANKTEGDT